MKMIALESLTAKPDDIKAVMGEIEQTGQVCLSQVKPYLQHFPITVGEHNFSEEPSPRGVGIALEGFAVLFGATIGAEHQDLVNEIIDRVQKAEPKISTAEVNHRNLQEHIKRFIPLANALSSVDEIEEFSRMPTELLNSAMAASKVNFGHEGTVSYKEAVEALEDALATSLQANCTAITADLLVRGKSIASAALSKLLQEFAYSIGKRAMAARKHLDEVGTSVAKDKVSEFVVDLTNFIKCEPRELLIIRIKALYDSVLGPVNDTFLRQEIAGVEDGSRELAGLTFELEGRLKGLESEPLCEELVERFSEAASHPYEAVELAGKVLESIRDIRLSTGEIRSLTSALETLREQSGGMHLPAEVEAGYNLFLQSLQRDVESLFRLAQIFQVEMLSLFTLLDLMGEGLVNVLETTAVFVANSDEQLIPQDVKDEFAKKCQASSKEEKIIATESLTMAAGLIVGIALVGILGAAAYFVYRLVARGAKQVRFKAMDKLESVGADANGILQGLKTGKFGQDVTAYFLKYNDEQVGLAKHVEAGEIDWTIPEMAKFFRVTHRKQKILEGKHSFLVEMAGSDFRTAVDVIDTIFRRGILADLEALRRNPSMTPDKLVSTEIFSKKKGDLREGRLGQAVNDWLKAAGYESVDVRSPDLNYTALTMRVEKVDVPLEKVVDLSKLISKRANDDFQVATTNLKALSSALKNEEQRLKKSNSDSAPNQNTTGELRRFVTILRKEIEFLDWMTREINAEIDDLNAMGAAKAGAIKSLYGEINHACVLGTKNGADSVELNGKLYALMSHVREVRDND